MKAAIVVLSDPSNGSDEALGRLFNALATAWDFKHRGDEVTILFQGAGTRWAGEIVRPEHPAHDLFKAVQDKVAGASCGCADVFGAGEGVQRSGFELIRDNPVPGTSGLPSLHNLATQGFSVLTF
ncbi:DsrE family protein [Engelhardtia mirabilis]|uniref:DsrE/DsrF-like family protein n=1 Tax=Engelhardtia mirabilis TaxID=2528011 RepID=A0A518BDT3_9BACT|nr:hypothetical protein Pla133_02130 [Planctomycetes bacterium Pla133]QDU99475.1 hypothetical protein Pla86_02130 [Planctomycetes bacterium Pla86]